MIRDAEGMGAREAYHLLIDTIVPRPIAWVTTRSGDGTPNLAPFSFFTGVTAAPPTIVFNVAPRTIRHPDGSRTQRDKDTLANLAAVPEFIVHTASRRDRDAVVLSAGDHAPEVDEIALAGLTTVPGTWVDVPRLVDAAVAMECRVAQLVRVGRQPVTMVLGEVLGWHVRDDVAPDGLRLRSAVWEPLGRLGVEGYQGDS